MRFVIDISEYDKEWIGNVYGIPQDINTKIAEAIINVDTIQPKRGKWILKSYRWECDQCGCLIRRANPFKGNEWNYNFCPNCGADMREVTE